VDQVPLGSIPWRAERWERLVEQQGVAYAKTVAETMKLKLEMDNPADREKLHRAVLDLVAGRKMRKRWGCVSAIAFNGRTIWIADAHRDDGKRFVVRAEEKLTAFTERESAVKLDWDKDTNWLLFDPNELQRFAQQKGGMMKKRRGKS
jgi:hypothetical protein